MSIDINVTFGLGVLIPTEVVAAWAKEEQDWEAVENLEILIYRQFPLLTTTHVTDQMNGDDEGVVVWVKSTTTSFDKHDDGAGAWDLNRLSVRPEELEALHTVSNFLTGELQPIRHLVTRTVS